MADYNLRRHTFACLQLNTGTSIKVVQGCLGHKSVTTTEVYAKLCDEQKRKALDVITLKHKETESDSVVCG